MNKIGAFLLCEISGEPEKIPSSWEREVFFPQISKFGGMTHLGNVVRNKHIKFEQDRSSYMLSYFGETQKMFKVKGGRGNFFFEFLKTEKNVQRYCCGEHVYQVWWTCDDWKLVKNWGN